jgi:hypothetical protein
MERTNVANRKFFNIMPVFAQVKQNLNKIEHVGDFMFVRSHGGDKAGLFRGKLRGGTEKGKFCGATDRGR